MKPITEKRRESTILFTGTSVHRNFLSRKAKIRLYKILARPTVWYARIVFKNSDNYDIKEGPTRITKSHVKRT